MAQIIVSCPNCQKPILIKAGSGYPSEVIMTESKKCQGCAADVEVQVKIVAKVKAEKAKA